MASIKCCKIKVNISLLYIKLGKYDLAVGGCVGLVLGERWGALHEGMHFSLKNALLLYFYSKRRAFTIFESSSHACFDEVKS